MNIRQLFRSLSLRLQGTYIFLSLVGVAFGIKSYIQIKNTFGVDDSQIFFYDLMFQITVAVLVNIIVALILYRIVTKPIKVLGDTMHALTENQLDVEIPYVDEVTEIGNMARKVQVFKETSIRARELAEHERSVTEETKSLQRKMEKKIWEFNTKVSDLLSGTNDAITSIHSSVQEMASAANLTSQASSMTEIAAKTTAEIVESVATASSELTASAQNIAAQVSHAARITNDSVSNTQKADVVTNQLDESTKKIGTIINLISNITAQINLLALNATIESARAGEAGKGFAVVASEVKSLSTETDKATKTIASHIAEIQQVVNSVISTISDIRTGIQQINEIAIIIASAAEEQSAATNEIAHNMQTASARIQEVFASTAQANKLSEQTNRNAHSVIENVASAQTQSSTLQQEIETFLVDIANA